MPEFCEGVPPNAHCRAPRRVRLPPSAVAVGGGDLVIHLRNDGAFGTGGAGARCTPRWGEIGSILERYLQLQDRLTYMDYHARLESRPKDNWEAVISVR
jgi:hypothetical protein